MVESRVDHSPRPEFVRPAYVWNPFYVFLHNLIKLTIEKLINTEKLTSDSISYSVHNTEKQNCLFLQFCTNTARPTKLFDISCKRRVSGYK